MFGQVFNKFFGSQADRTFKKFLPALGEAKRFEAELGKLDDGQLQHKTFEFKELLSSRIGPRGAQIQELANELRGDLDAADRDQLNSQYDAVQQEIRDLEETVLDELMPQAFSVVREACRRLMGCEWDVMGNNTSWDMVPYDVQMFGGTVLHDGKIAEMATGEGKTLVATMPLYLNALTGRGVHLITHNNYLAKRDAMWMGPLLQLSGAFGRHHPGRPSDRRFRGVSAAPTQRRPD